MTDEHSSLSAKINTDFDVAVAAARIGNTKPLSELLRQIAKVERPLTVFQAQQLVSLIPRKRKRAGRPKGTRAPRNAVEYVEDLVVTLARRRSHHTSINEAIDWTIDWLAAMVVGGYIKSNTPLDMIASDSDAPAIDLKQRLNVKRIRNRLITRKISTN